MKYKTRVKLYIDIIEVFFASTEVILNNFLIDNPLQPIILEVTISNTNNLHSFMVSSIFILS